VIERRQFAARLSEAWDFIDKRDIDKHAVAAIIIIYGTLKLTSWGIAFAERWMGCGESGARYPGERGGAGRRSGAGAVHDGGRCGRRILFSEAAMTRVYVWIAVALSIIGFGAYVIHSYNVKLAESDLAGYERGKLEVRSAALSAALAETERVRAEKKKADREMAELRDQLQQEKANAKAAEDRVLAGIADGSVRLSIHADSAQRDCGAAGGASGASAGADGDGGGELLGKADAAFLVAEASRADSVARKLGRAQQLIQRYLELCGSVH
jgi:hypothetical protein